MKGTLCLGIYQAVLALALLTPVSPPVFVLAAAALGLGLALRKRKEGGEK